jgi:hypothetical protein
MNLSVFVFWLYVVSAIITALVESRDFVRALAHDERHLQSTPGYTPTTTWGSAVWAVVRVFCPVLNTILALAEVLERLASLVERLDRPILRKRKEN